MSDENNEVPNGQEEEEEEQTPEPNILVLSVVLDLDKGAIKIHHRPRNTVLALGMANYARLMLEDQLMNPMNQKKTAPKIVKPNLVLPGDIGRKQ